MGWSGRAPAPPAREAGKGRQRQGARHAQQAQYSDRLGDRYRHRQELVPRRGPRSARYHRAAAEVVTRPGGSAARQPAAMLDRHGGLRRRASPQPQAADAWARRPADACEVRAPLLEGPEERLPRRGGDRRSGATPDHEVRRDQDRRTARPAGAAPRARAVGWPAHRRYQSDPRLPSRARHRGTPGAAFPADRAAGHPGHTQRCPVPPRSEEHTSELQSRENLVCRLLLEKKKKKIIQYFGIKKKNKKKTMLKK